MTGGMHTAGVRFALCLAIVAFAATGALARSGASSCVTCHTDMGDELAAHVGSWNKSVHAQAGISCHDCHGGDPANDDMDAAMSPDAGYTGTPAKVDVPRLCASCHADAERMKRYNIRIDQYELYITSQHGRALATGDTNVAVCSTCHGSHEVYRAASAKSPTHRRNVPKLCATCHADEKLMSKYGIPADQYDLFVKSHHGKLLLEKDDRRAPSCADCHGNHGAVPPGAESLVEVCHTCHAVTADYYKESIHYEVSRDAGLPLCIHCHGDHDVSLPDESLLVGDQERHCGYCHDGGSAAAALGASIREKLGNAGARIDAVRERIDRAEQFGMDPLDSIERLERAESAMIEAIPVVHTLDPERIGEQISGVVAEAEAADDEVGKLLDDYRKRREALWIFAFFFAAAMALLFGKLVQVLRSQGLPVFGHKPKE